MPAPTPTPTPCSFVAHSGVNLPWINYGWDVGRHPWGGVHGGFVSNEPTLREDLQFLAQHKVRVVRVFIFCDLRSGVFFDQSGTPTQFDPYVWLDLDELFELAEEYGLRLIPVLFDFHLANGVAEENGTPVGEHPDVISDASKRQALLDIFRPLIRSFSSRPALLAWEVMNEPEYASAVTRDDLEVFVREFAHMIHAEAPGAAVTLGSKDWPDLASWTDVGLDLYQFHWYTEGVALPSVAGLALDKPVLIGETRPTQVSSKLTEAQSKGYLGLLFWSLNANWNFSDVADEYLQWAEAHWTGS